MRAHQIENGVVVNTIEVESLDFMPNLVEATEGGIGWTYANGVFTQPAADPLAYRFERLTQYPSIGDQLDALWKGGDAAVAMLAKVQEVKAKYPKPESL
jgi:hypothetical protein